MTRLRKMMLEELQRRDYSQTTVKNYLGTVEDFAKHFRRSPDQLGPEQIPATRCTCCRRGSWSAGWRADRGSVSEGRLAGIGGTSRLRVE